MSIAYGFNTHHSTPSHLNSGHDSISNIPPMDVAPVYPIIEIHVSCKKLVKLDVGSQSDPMCVLFAKQNNRFTEVSRTEVIWNDPNPNFVRSFKTYYIFESMQPLRFEVYDADSEKAPLKAHDFIGYCETDVQRLVSNLEQEIAFDLIHDKSKGYRGTIYLTCQQTKESSSYINGQIQVNKLKKIKTFAKDNPFIEISKPSESGRNLPVYRSEVKEKCFGCTFKNFSIPLQTICNGDLNNPVTISCYDYQKRKAAKLIGKYDSSLMNLMENVRTHYEFSNGSKSKSMGEFWFNSLNIVQVPTFVDYLCSGLQLNMITAIDFTASNRDPEDPRSLHHFVSGSQLNQYQQCIFSIGSILTKYDNDQQFPVYGFGGKINGQVSHCFPLTFNPSQPNVSGLQGILQAYQNSLMKVQLSGPTLFAPIISSAAQVANHSFATSHTYTVLLILTDGVINDMRETTDAIVAATDSPLSIIIIGVGNANFSAMDALDADENPLVSSSGVRMKRDIVQFVPFNKYQANNGFGLEAEVLAEVPRQVHEFCSTHGFVPQLSHF